MNVIRVSAIWCMSCLVMKNRYDRIFKTYKVEEIIDLDYDEDEKEIKKLKIGETLPVVLIYKNNKEIKRIVGEKTKKELKEIMNTLNEET